MANSYVLYTGNGSTQDFTVPFGYIDEDHVTVEVDGIEVAAAFTTGSSIQTTVAPAAATEVKVKRATPKSTMVTFSDATGLTAADLNLQGTQARYIAEEQEDAYLLGGLTDLSVHESNLVDGAVTTTKLGDLSVTTGKLAASAVTTAKITDANVTNAKLADMATTRIKGRVTALTGVPEDLTAAQATTILNTFTADSGGNPGLKGLVPAPANGDAAANKVLGVSGWQLAGVATWWGKITNTTALAVTATGAATLNRLHVISGTSGNYDITLSGLSPSAGDVVGFYVKDYAAASKLYRLDAGGTVKIAGRTRYLTLVHTNVVLLLWDGTDWQPLVLNLDSIWVAGGAVTPTATTTGPTKGTTTTDQMWWRRIGDSCQFRYEYVQTVGGADGTGTYLIPFLFTADTAKVNTSGTGTVDQPRNSVGFGQAGTALFNVMLFDSTRVYAQRISDLVNGLWSAATAGWSGAKYTQLNFQLPISDW